MQFQFFTLEEVKTFELIKVFNLAFADYFVKIKINEKSLSEKILAENIVLEKSVGAFFEGNLVGFVLLGIENKIAYNGGTGVLPKFRGKALTLQMYNFILPGLEIEGIRSHQLEVITENFPAIGTYEKIGFEKTRTLVCLKGKITTFKINKDIQFKSLDETDETVFPTFFNSQPSWQNSLSAINRTKNLYQIIGAFVREELIGYFVYSENGRVKQFAVKKEFRQRGVGQSLFGFLNSKLQGKEIVITNVEKSDLETVSFLKKLGLTCFLEQFEMKLVKSESV